MFMIIIVRWMILTYDGLYVRVIYGRLELNVNVIKILIMCFARTFIVNRLRFGR